MTNNTSLWYKEPWAWLVFFLPFSAVVAGTATYFIANHEADDLVIGEYYKEGKAINLQVAKVRLAKKLGMRFDLSLIDNELLITPTGIEKTFPLINANFYHPTQEEKDFYLVLTPDGQGNFRHSFEKEVKGKWRLSLSSFEGNWKIQQTIMLPQSKNISIVPDVTRAH